MTSMFVGAIALALSAAGPAPAFTQQGSAQRPWTADIQGFNIVLLVGEIQGTSGPVDDLPQGARRALNDMKEFLPYKSYRVLDSQWTSCCGQSSTVNIGGRLQGVYAMQTGPNASDIKLLPRPYEFYLFVRGTSSSDALQVQFHLRDETASTSRVSPQTERAIADARDELATVGVQLEQMKGRVEIGTAAPSDARKLQDRHASIQRKIEALQAEAEFGRRNSGGRTVINTTFSMDVGETVVVGTSRLGGNKALIALVTAAKRSGGAGRD